MGILLVIVALVLLGLFWRTVIIGAAVLTASGAAAIGIFYAIALLIWALSPAGQYKEELTALRNVPSVADWAAQDQQSQRSWAPAATLGAEGGVASIP